MILISPDSMLAEPLRYSNEYSLTLLIFLYLAEIDPDKSRMYKGIVLPMNVLNILNLRAYSAKQFRSV